MSSEKTCEGWSVMGIFKNRVLISFVAAALIMGISPFSGLPQAQAAEDDSTYAAEEPVVSGSDALPDDNDSGALPEDSDSGILPDEGSSGILPEEGGLLPSDNDSGILPGNNSLPDSNNLPALPKASDSTAVPEGNSVSPMSTDVTPMGGDYGDIKLQVMSDLKNNPQAQYVEGEVLVVFKSEVTAAGASDALKLFGSLTVESMSGDSDVSDMAVVKLKEGMSVLDAITELNTSSQVAYAQPNYIYHLFGEPEAIQEGDGAAESLDAQGDLSPDANTPTAINDTLKTEQWVLQTTKLYNAWSLTRASASSVAVAVIDSGVITSHEDLVNNIVPGSYYDATGSKLVGDGVGHGTHVAGIIAAQANNGKGVAGVSYNARIVPIRVADKNGGMTTLSVRNGYTYLLAKPSGSSQTRAQQWNVKVVNMSLGGYDSDPAVETKINQAYNAGILTVCAAGNDSTSQPSYPAAYTNCISVSALKQGTGVLKDVFDSSYSNFGSTIDLSAPGTHIGSTYNRSTSDYVYLDGTSMASPYVAGAAALVFAAKPTATPAQVRAALQNTAADLGAKGKDQYYGYGEVDAYAAALQIGVTGITNDTPKGYGIPINCKVSSTLPMATTWTWTVTSGPGTINSSGVLTPTGTGTITVKATYTKDTAVYATKSITVSKLAISKATGTLSTTTYTYNGLAKKPAVTVTYQGKTLRSGTDYTVAYSSNTNAGTGKVVLTGTGTWWNGTKTLTFKINPAQLSSTTVTIPATSYTYTATAIKPVPTVKFTDGNSTVKTLKSGTDYTVTYSKTTNPTNGGAQVIVKGTGNFTGSVTKTFSIKGAAITYSTYVQNIGKMSAVNNGNMGGTVGQGLRVEALKINLINNTGISGNIVYQTQIQDIGWQLPRTTSSTGLSDQVSLGDISGTEGQSRRLETLKIKLTGNLANSYDIYYRVHVQDIGWMGWAKNGGTAIEAGTVGLSLRIEAMQIYLVPKTGVAPGNTFKGISIVAPYYPSAIDGTAAGTKGAISYNAMVHIQYKGNTYYKNDDGSKQLGTTGQGLRLEALELDLINKPVTGSLSYEVHVQDIGWQGAKTDGQLAGTEGQSRRLEAIRINRTGNLAKQYDVYYRTHVQNIGWTGWAKNGQSCGSAGYGWRMEAMQIVFVAKGAPAPGFNSGYFYQA